MAIFRRAKPPELPANAPGADDRPMQPYLPEVPEDDLLIDSKSWEGLQGWHGEGAQRAAETLLRDSKTKAVRQQQQIANEWMTAQTVAKADAAPCCCCGGAVQKAVARMTMGNAWRYCPGCWVMQYAEPEVGRRRLAFLRQLLPDLPADVVAADLNGTVHRYYCELPDTQPTGESVEPWSWLRRDTLRDQILDNHRVRFQKHRAPGEFSGRCCGGCGVLLALRWSSESVPVTRPGHEQEPRLPLCSDCCQVLIASGGDPRSPSWGEFLFWKALDLDMGRVEPNWAGEHGFVPYARRYCDADPEFHDFTRPWGWVAEADLAAVRDKLLTSVPNRSLDRETQARYRRKERLRFLRAQQHVEPPPVPAFSVTPTAPQEEASGWRE